MTSQTALRATAFHGLLFGTLSMLGPFGIDFYLPAFPAISRDFSIGAGPVQLSLGIYIAALACGPLWFGSLSDRHGRRPVLFWAMAVFGASSLLCSIAPNVWALIGFRILQGLGAAGMTVMARAMVRDVARDHMASRLLALSFLVQSISPLLAPVCGAALLAFMSWRLLFVIIAALTTMVACLAYFQIPETLVHAARQQTPQRISSAVRVLLMNQRYVAMSLMAGCATAGGFGFMTAAPFILVKGLGVSEAMIGVVLAGMSICHVVSTQLSPRLGRQVGFDMLLFWATTAGLICAVIMAVLAWAGVHTLAAILLPTAGLFMIYGLTLTPASVGAMDAATHGVGTAAALLGTIQLATAAIASVGLSVFSNGSSLPFALFSLIAATIAVIAAKRSRSLS